MDELLNLVTILFGPGVWNDRTPLILEIRKQINDVLISYGATLEYFRYFVNPVLFPWIEFYILRIEATSDDSDLNIRAIQLCFLHNCANFLSRMIPLSQTGLILPRNLKNALANSLVDVTLSKLYPNLYNTLLNYVQVTIQTTC